MKLPILLGALLGLGSLLPGQAQQLPAAPPPAPLSVPPALTHADSLAVLHQTFRRARRTGRYITLLEGVAASALTVSATSPGRNGAQTGSQALVSVVTAAELVGSIVRWSRFSQRHEREAALQFEQHQAREMPRYVLRYYNQMLLVASRRAMGTGQ